jgi:multidrug efflux system membrane fusion protein
VSQTNDSIRPAPGAKRRGRRWPWLVAAAVAVVAGLLLWRYYGGASSGSAHKYAGGAPQAVGAATATLADVPILDSGLGTVTPLATITVQSQIAGLLTSGGLHRGPDRQAGRCARADRSAPVRGACWQQARGSLARDQALLGPGAAGPEKRYETLNKQDSIARQQAEDQRYVVQQDQGTVALRSGQRFKPSW